MHGHPEATQQQSRGHDCSLSVATLKTLLPREQIQSLRHASHGFGSPDRPGRRTSIAVFSLRGDASPAVVFLLLLLAGDIELNPGPNCYTCRKIIRRGMDSLQCQVNSCANGSHKQLSCSGFHRSQLTHPWRCPPHGVPALLTEQPRQLSVTAVSGQSTQVPGPSHVLILTAHAFPTLQGDAMTSPPAREGGCAGSSANQTAVPK